MARSATLPYDYALRAMPSVTATWLLVASMVIASIFLLVLPERLRTNDNSDYPTSYEPTARNILRGDGVVDQQGALAIRYPPGYPVILAGAFLVADHLRLQESAVLSAMAVALMGVSSVLVFLMARRFWGSRPAVLAWVAWITYPLALYLLKQPNSEVPFMAVLFGAYYFYWRGIASDGDTSRLLVLCGVLLGISMLIRPIAMAVPAILAARLTLVRTDSRPGVRLRLAGALLLGTVLTVAPWEMWIYARTGRVIALSTAGETALRDGLTFAVRSKGFRQAVWVPQDVELVMRNISAQYPKLTAPGAIARVLVEEFRQRPLAVTKLFALKAARGWYGTDSHRFEMPVAIVQSFYLVLTAWASVLAWRRGGVWRQICGTVWATTLYFWGVSTVGSTLARYMVPAMGLLFVLLPALWVGSAQTSTAAPQEIH